MLNTQRHDLRVRRQAGLHLESLDDRILLASGALGPTAEALVHHQPIDAHTDHPVTSHVVLTDRSPAALPINVSASLRSLYRDYKEQVRVSPSTISLPSNGVVSISGLKVAVRIKVGFPPALGSYLDDLRSDGLQLIRTVPADGVAEGLLPISKLGAVARIAAHVWPTSLTVKS